jgi:hypothetical protein
MKTPYLTYLNEAGRVVYPTPPRLGPKGWLIFEKDISFDSSAESLP